MSDLAQTQSEITELFAYYQRPLTSYILGIWTDFLAIHLTQSEVHQAMVNSITKEKELPTPEHFVESVKGTGYFCLLTLKQNMPIDE
jgi:hypothetical protein